MIIIFIRNNPVERAPIGEQAGEEESMPCTSDKDGVKARWIGLYQIKLN